jgi:hypothetical protein
LAAPPDDPRAILTHPFNASLSNMPWQVKKPALLTASLLPINQQLHRHDQWGETDIAARGKELFDRALTIWPRHRLDLKGGVSPGFALPIDDEL